MKTTYKVTSATRFRGYAEGEEFEADLSEEQERRAVERGAIRVVKRPETKPKRSKKQEEETHDG